MWLGDLGVVNIPAGAGLKAHGKFVTSVLSIVGKFSHSVGFVRYACGTT